MSLNEIREFVLDWSKGIKFNEHTYDKSLKINGQNFRIRPDDTFYIDNEVIIVEYERTKRPVESITKYFWLFNNTDWLEYNRSIKLFFIIATDELKQNNIRVETVILLGNLLEKEYPNNFKFRFLHYHELEERRIKTELKAL